MIPNAGLTTNDNLVTKSALLQCIAVKQGRIRVATMRNMVDAAMREAIIVGIFLREQEEVDPRKALWWFCILIAREEVRRPCGLTHSSDTQNLIRELAEVIR